MSTPFATKVGSGTVPYTYGILDPADRGALTGGNGVRQGTQVLVANPEDLVAVDAFAASGVTVGTTAVEIVGPHNNPLPRCRQVILQNSGGQAVFISHRPDFPTLDAFQLPTGGTAGTNRRVTLSLLHNVSIYAKTSTGTSTVRILIL